jgi:cytochrome b involved in lipid metabolism
VKEGAKVAPPEAPSNGNIYSMTEVAKHNTKEDLWVVHEGKVFDVTKFVDAHPGGARILTKKGGDDISKIFNEIHSDNARKKLNEHYIGNLAGKPKL